MSYNSVQNVVYMGTKINQFFSEQDKNWYTNKMSLALNGDSAKYKYS